MQYSLTPASPSCQPFQEEWKTELSQAYSSVSDLLEHKLITAEEGQKLETLGEKFVLRVTPYYASLMKNSSSCPIRKQGIPHLNEMDPDLPEWATQASQEIYRRPTPWYPDAIGDVQNLIAPRLTHRYPNRAILHLTSLCAVYCRFCFRKSHLSNHEAALYQGNLDPAFDYLKKNTQIRELILTGGDPLSSTDLTLNRLFQRIHSLPHIKSVRIHSRMTTTLPSRFTPSLLDIFKSPWNFQIHLASHFNHPQELTAQARARLHDLRLSGVTLLNQTVLLNSVNDSPEILAELFQTLYELGVIPFYLHHPDWTPGTFHFRTSIERGKSIFAQLKGLISGPSLPSYTLDIPGGFGKISLMDSDQRKIKDFPSDSNSKMGGAIYELTSPQTRNHPNSHHLYLDLFSTR